MRVLVTGSRDWPYRTVVAAELDKVLKAHPGIHLGGQLIVVHGGARGADQAAEQWANEMSKLGFRVRGEKHPAEWDKHGKAAGPLRNQQMVDAGADLCLAFRYMGSKGTNDCVNRAGVAGIPIRLLELDLIELKGKPDGQEKAG